MVIWWNLWNICEETLASLDYLVGKFYVFRSRTRPVLLSQQINLGWDVKPPERRRWPTAITIPVSYFSRKKILTLLPANTDFFTVFLIHFRKAMAESKRVRRFPIWFRKGDEQVLSPEISTGPSNLAAIVKILRFKGVPLE